MNPNLNNDHQLNWELILFSVVYVCLELGCYINKGKLYSVLLLDHVKDTIVNLGEELASKGSGKKVCGIVLAMIVISFIAIIFYGIHSIFTHADALEPLIFTVIMTIFAIPVILGFHWLNNQYISWIK